MAQSVPQPKIPALSPGSDIAGFRILKDLGTGAASRLYLVQDRKTKHIWALKHVRRITDKDQRFLDQTEIEYNVGSKLIHPALRHVEKLIKNRRVIRVTEIFLLMEFVDGSPLDQSPPSDINASVAIFTQVAEGLYYMNQKGYVHADIKPNNIIVALDTLKAKVIDLGQSCPIGTKKERIQGTIDYIAPEQVHRREITSATDVYNLGATMYWCLTGKHIPTAMSNRNGSLGLAKDEHLLERPPSPNEIKEDIPGELSDLVMDCIEPVPTDRISMKGLRNKLQIIQVRFENQEKAG